MIAAIKGTLLTRIGDNVVVDVNGVGYELSVTSTALDSLGASGSDVKLVVYTDVRETAISLFGFASQAEKEVFLLLKKVKGVGSKLAQTIVSSLGAERVFHAIGTADVASLTRVPGVGKKTAERVVVELRETVGSLAGESSAVSSLAQKIEPIVVAEGQLASDVSGDAVLALEKLGFTSDRAAQAVRLAIAEHKETNPGVLADAGELLKVSLAHL